MAQPAPQSTVFFDGSCALCRAEIGYYRRTDAAGDLCFIDVSEAHAAPPEGVTPQQAMARFHVRLPDGSLQSGAAGFVALWLALPRWRWLGRLAGHRRVLPVLERLYVLFLPWRARIARLVFRQARSARPSSAL